MSEKKVGRPSKLEDLDLARVEYYAGLGLTEEEIGIMLGVTRQTIYAHKKKNPAFLDAITKGKLESDVKIMASLRQVAISGDVQAIRFWLMNRQPDKWRDKREHEITGNINFTLSDKYLPEGSGTEEGGGSKP